MKTTLLILAGAAALSLAACNKPAQETATDTGMQATPAPADSTAMSGSTTGAASTDAASTGAMSAATSTTGRSGGSGSQSMTPAANSTMTPMSPNASANPTTQETIAATKDTLSPAGASSGPTAPAPKH